MSEKLKDCLTLFYVCFIMGLTCFGGGYAMIPVMEREFVTKRKYVDEKDMGDIVSLAQSLPGLISFNAVILIAYRKAGILGAICAVLGLMIPSLVVITLVVLIYEKIEDNKWVNAALQGIKCAVIGVLIYAIYKLSKNTFVKWYHYMITVVVLILAICIDINPIYLILAVGVIYTSSLYLKDMYQKKKWEEFVEKKKASGELDKPKEEKVENKEEIEEVEDNTHFAIDLNAVRVEQEEVKDEEEYMFSSTNKEENLNKEDIDEISNKDNSEVEQ